MTYKKKKRSDTLIPPHQKLEFGAKLSPPKKTQEESFLITVSAIQQQSSQICPLSTDSGVAGREPVGHMVKPCPGKTKEILKSSPAHCPTPWKCQLCCYHASLKGLLRGTSLQKCLKRNTWKKRGRKSKIKKQAHSLEVRQERRRWSHSNRFQTSSVAIPN